MQLYLTKAICVSNPQPWKINGVIGFQLIAKISLMNPENVLLKEFRHNAFFACKWFSSSTLSLVTETEDVQDPNDRLRNTNRPKENITHLVKCF